MRRFLLHLSYFGTRYNGFQKQNLDGNHFYDDPLTICGLLEIGLKGCKPANHPVVYPSSRTDKGVHALSNTVHVDLEPSGDWISSRFVQLHLNHFFEYNDHDIRILKVQQVPDTFHSRYSAYERRYLYRFAVPKPNVPFRETLALPIPLPELNRCYFTKCPQFDAEAVRSACSIFVGLKDFAALCSKPRPTNKEVRTERDVFKFELVKESPFLPSSQLLEEYDFWHFICHGRAFLYHQVRRMVAAQITYGQGKVTRADIQDLVDKPVDSSWRKINVTVPPHGLYLTDVLYRPEDLEYTEESVEEVEAKKLEEELTETNLKLKNFQGSVMEKIELKKKVLDIKKRLGGLKHSELNEAYH